MKAACEARRAETAGACADECSGIGWCRRVYDSARPRARRAAKPGESGEGRRACS
ncbi:MAG: hypothetical protein IJI16_05045 [Atopobiaceae bacterium]|nr:hypothetical protein [Atopobiaceae bacterium]